MAKTLGMNHSWISIGRKIEWLSVDEKSFFQLREQHETCDRRLGRRSQKTVLTARIPTDDGGGGKSANPIGL